jgi:hypothetical protein
LRSSSFHQSFILHRIVCGRLQEAIQRVSSSWRCSLDDNYNMFFCIGMEYRPRAGVYPAPRGLLAQDSLSGVLGRTLSHCFVLCASLLFSRWRVQLTFWFLLYHRKRSRVARLWGHRRSEESGDSSRLHPCGFRSSSTPRRRNRVAQPLILPSTQSSQS